jgi:CheY-like chemotaxis protein
VAVGEEAGLGTSMRRKWHILVVSHQIAMRTLLNILLTRIQQNVEAVTSRAETMAIIEQKLPDLVILDLYLADEPSLAFASDLRALYPQLPILLISSPAEAATDEDIHSAAQLGFKVLNIGPGRYEFYVVMHELLDDGQHVIRGN